MSYFGFFLIILVVLAALVIYHRVSASTSDLSKPVRYGKIVAYEVPEHGRVIKHAFRKLTEPKKRVDDHQFRKHREECLKALLEDRFHNRTQKHSNKRSMAMPPAFSAGGIPLSDEKVESRKPWGW